MRVSSTTQAPPDTAADTIAVGVFEGKAISHDVDGVLQGLVDSGEAKPGPAQARRRARRRAAVRPRRPRQARRLRRRARPRGGRGRRRPGEGARHARAVLGAAAPHRGAAASSRARCWRPTTYRAYKSGDDDDAADRRADRLRARRRDAPTSSAPPIAAEAANAARDLQNAPGQRDDADGVRRARAARSPACRSRSGAAARSWPRAWARSPASRAAATRSRS